MPAGAMANLLPVTPNCEEEIGFTVVCIAGVVRKWRAIGARWS